MSNYNASCSAINQIFKDKFYNSYTILRKKRKNRIIKYLSSIYRRWFYSALIEDTSLTPANLFAILDVHDPTEESLTFHIPVLRPIKNIRDPLEFNIVSYSDDNHPIIEDLRILMNSCTPDISLNENDMLEDDHVESLMEKLSLWDCFYVEYLLNISIVMGLIKKSPSIHANRAQVTPEYEELMKLPNKEIFKKVVNASIESASAFINEMIPLPEPYFTVDLIKSLLKSPIALDDIFQDVYGLIGVDIEDIYNSEGFEEDPIDYDVNSAVITSTFLMGLLLDKWFLTPFGYYLRLIRPLYTLPYEFDNELNYLAESFSDDEGPVTALYAPSTYYQLTPLGKKYFEVTDSGKASSQEALPFDSLVNIVESKIDDPDMLLRLLKEEYTHAVDIHSSIYLVKIRLVGQKNLWKNVEIPSSINLHQLFCEICYEFSLDPSAEYSFFNDTTENPFNEYTSKHHPRRSKKAHTVTLHDLNFSEKHKFILVLINAFNPYVNFTDEPLSKRIKFELEVVRIKSREYGYDYPRVSRMSSAFRDFEV